MPDDLAQQINECIAKYNGTDDASLGQVQGVVYKVGGKRLVLSNDMERPVEIAGVRMTTLEAQRRLSFPDYVKAILGKTDEEKAGQRSERAENGSKKARKPAAVGSGSSVVRRGRRWLRQ